MRSAFSISHEWLHSKMLEDSERATQAKVYMLATTGHRRSHLMACESRWDEEVRDYARLSTLPIAHWFKSNWWRLLWEASTEGGVSPDWKMSHKIGAAGEGYVYPDITFTSDWDTVHIQAKGGTRFRTAPISYTESCNVFVPVDDFRQAMAGLIEETIDRLNTTGEKGNELAAIWNIINEEQSDPEQAEWRKMEACLGYDPDEAPEDLVEKLLSMYSSDFGAEAVQEVAVASKDKATNDIDILSDYFSLSRPQWSVRVEGRSKILDQMNANIHNGYRRHDVELPWQRASRAARVAREVWQLAKDPIATSKLTEIFGVNIQDEDMVSDSMTGQIPLSAGMRARSDGDFDIILRQRHPTGRRFALARLIGDFLNDSKQEPLMPATNAKTNRQKFQRAFAQEFLCPAQELGDYLNLDMYPFPTEDDIDDAAHHFDVSPATVQMTLVNKGMVEREMLYTNWEDFAQLPFFEP